MATKHHVLQPGKMSPEQLAQLESDYERDLAANAKAAEAEKAGASAKEKGKAPGKDKAE